MVANNMVRILIHFAELNQLLTFKNNVPLLLNVLHKLQQRMWRANRVDKAHNGSQFEYSATVLSPAA